MKISVDWLGDYVELPAGTTPARLAHDLTLTTVEVEGFEDVGDDVVLEIDNRSLTNRPDLWGHYGIAREVAVIYGRPLAPLPVVPPLPAATDLVGDIDPGTCRRYAAVRLALDGPARTPARIRERLARVGGRSVGLWADLADYVSFAVGQPLHVYDAERVALPLSAGPTGERARMELVTGATVELPEGTPVVRDAHGPVAVAGVLGGAASAPAGPSRRFVLEAATFAAGPVRRASQRLKLRSEASTRYEKELDTQRVDAALGLFLHLLAEAAPAAEVTAMQQVTPDPTRCRRVEVDRDFLDRRIGASLPDAEILAILRSLGFTADQAGRTLSVVAPSWRSTGDVALPHDIVEEVARVHGYGRLPAARPSVVLEPARELGRRPVGRLVREQLAARGGLTEILTYPWSADHLLAGTGHAKEDTLRIDGAPAPDRDSLRPSLVPNMLEAVAANRRHRRDFGLFEVGAVYSRGPLSAGAPPVQSEALALALVGGDGVELFRRARGLLEMLRRHCHLVQLSTAGDTDVAWADPSARVAVTAGAATVGTLALVRPRVCRASGIESAQVVCAELDLGGLAVRTSRENRSVPPPDLPGSDFDLSVLVADHVRWDAVEGAVRRAGAEVSDVAYVGEYRGSWVPAGTRSLTLTVTIHPATSTLTTRDIAAVRSEVLAALSRDVDARLR